MRSENASATMQMASSCQRWDALDALAAILMALDLSFLLDAMGRARAGCLPSERLEILAICCDTARSTASVVSGSTGRSTRMPHVRAMNFHVGVTLKRCMTGPDALTLLAGTQDGFQTTSNSFSPVNDSRSAKMSCTSQHGTPLCADPDPAANGMRTDVLKHHE